MHPYSGIATLTYLMSGQTSPILALSNMTHLAVHYKASHFGALAIDHVSTTYRFLTLNLGASFEQHDHQPF